MKKKPNSGEATLQSIRRNSAYSTSRLLTLIFTLVFGFSMILIAYLISSELPKNEKTIMLLIGSLLGGFGGMCVFHFLNAHFDQSDALIQVAKFQERSLSRKNDAISLVEKIRQDVEEEKQDESSQSDCDPSDKSMDEIPDQKPKSSDIVSELGEEPKSAG